MVGLDIIMTSNFSQALQVWDSWIFKSKIDGFNVLTTIFLVQKCKTLWIETSYVTKWFW
jgi:hypothetical protein